MLLFVTQMVVTLLVKSIQFQEHETFEVDKNNRPNIKVLLLPP
jgi:hypothetical protein